MLNNQTKTANYGLSFLSPYQAQKELIVNENINKLDLLLNRGVISFTNDVSASSLKYGDLIIIPDQTTDPNSLQYKNYLCCKTDELNYIKPREGMLFWAQEENCLIVYRQDKWQKLITVK